MSKLEIIPVVRRHGQYPPPKSLIEMIEGGPEYLDALFVYLDNATDHRSPHVGSGWHGTLRPYNRYGRHSSYPRTAGIPIMRSHPNEGFYFQSMTDPGAHTAIDIALDEIQSLIPQHGYAKLIFAATAAEDPEDLPVISSDCISYEVQSYITYALYALGDSSNFMKAGSYYMDPTLKGTYGYTERELSAGELNIMMRALRGDEWQDIAE